MCAIGKNIENNNYDFKWLQNYYNREGTPASGSNAPDAVYLNRMWCI